MTPSAPERIPVSAPVLSGNERKYVTECLETNWITSGSFVPRFEQAFAAFCGCREAVAVVNGTAALHVALLAAGIGPGDEVIVPTLTYIATANAVTYCGATAVFADSEPATWNIAPTSVSSLVTPRTKAIIPVHLYGHPADMDPLLDLARQHRLIVIEDAAEAHGALYKGRKTGSLADMAVFSFYGNKVITTGEGGMITLDDPALADRCRLLRGQGMDPHRRYYFPIVGYNYRMTNVSAAIGLGQCERLEALVARKREIARLYNERLQGTPGLRLPPEAPWARNIYWMYTVLIEDDFGLSRDEVAARLDEQGIETRPVFLPLHTMPPYKDHPRGGLCVAESIARKGVNLPSGCGLTDEQVDRVCSALKHIALKARG